MAGMDMVFAKDFLQQHHVNICFAYEFAHARQYEGTVAGIKAFVDVPGQHTQLHVDQSSWRKVRSLALYRLRLLPPKLGKVS